MHFYAVPGTETFINMQGKSTKNACDRAHLPALSAISGILSAVCYVLSAILVVLSAISHALSAIFNVQLLIYSICFFHCASKSSDLARSTFNAICLAEQRFFDFCQTSSSAGK